MDKVFVYFNLHKKVFSIKDQKTNLVTGHSYGVIIHNAEFKVSEAGRQRVIREQRKNVHAGVKGLLVQTINEPQEIPDGFRSATYNPYRFDTFVDQETLQPIRSATVVILQGKKIYYKEVA